MAYNQNHGNQPKGFQQGGYQGGNKNESEPYRPSFNKTDFADVTALEINEVADKKGKEFKPIKTNQIRNFFSHFGTIKNKYKTLKINNQPIDQLDTNLILIKPKLAYAKGRNPVVEPFQSLIFEVIDLVYNSKNKEKAYINFFEFVEAIVAYHKYYGGKDQ